MNEIIIIGLIVFAVFGLLALNFWKQGKDTARILSRKDWSHNDKEDPPQT